MTDKVVYVDLRKNFVSGDFMEYQKILLGQTPYFVSCAHSSYHAHFHNETELLYCVRGNIKVVIDDEEYNMSEDCILLISSLSMHQIIIENNAVALVLEFGTQFLGTEYNKFAEKKFSKCLFTPNEECDFINRLIKPLRRLYKEYSEGKVGSHWAIQGLLFELYAVIIRYVPMEKQSDTRRKNLAKYLRIQNVFELVQNEYANEITLERAASYVGYDPRAFCRLFKLTTNMTFHNYLNSYRINVSMRLLENKSYTIGEIGQMVGIPVAKTFSRLFRKYANMSPSEYRSMYLTKKP